MRRALALAVVLALTGSAWSAEPLGRFFFTPAERAQLDIARSRKAPPPAAAEVEAPAPQVITYGGMVRRSDGKSLVWLNNRLVAPKDALAGFSVSGRVRPDGALSLHDSETGRSVDLKVGQSVEFNSGAIGEPRMRALATPRIAGAPKARAEEAAGESTQGDSAGTSERRDAPRSAEERGAQDAR